MKTAFEYLENVDDFSIKEFPQGELEHTNWKVLFMLQRFRNEWNQPVYPSTVKGSWARFDGSKTSRHYAIDRLSTAGDLFPSGNVFEAWMLLQQLPIGGLGIYFDTNRIAIQPGPMIHIDMREARLLWCRIGGEYFYLNIGSVKERKQAQLKFLNAVQDYIEYELK